LGENSPNPVALIDADDKSRKFYGCSNLIVGHFYRGFFAVKISMLAFEFLSREPKTKFRTECKKNKPVFTT
jgi:hypothetical protein